MKSLGQGKQPSRFMPTAQTSHTLWFRSTSYRFLLVVEDAQNNTVECHQVLKLRDGQKCSHYITICNWEEFL